MHFPLPPEAVHALPVSDKQINAYQAQVYQVVEHALREYDRFEVQGAAMYAASWRTTAKSEDMRVVRRRDAALPLRFHYRVFGALDGDYHHVMEFLHADTTEELLEWQRIMHPTLLDAGVLATFRSSTPSHPHQSMGIRWSAMQIVPWDRVFTSYLEYLGYMKDSKGRSIGVRVMIPVEIPQLAVLMDAMKVKRYDHTTVQIVRRSRSQSKPGRTRSYVFHVIQHDHPTLAPVAFDLRLLEGAQQLCQFAITRQIIRTGLMRRANWTPDASRRVCFVCRRAFGTTRRRHHCRLCGEVICRKCVRLHDAPRYSASGAFRLRVHKFCVLCITNLQERPPEVLSSGGRDGRWHSISSSASIVSHGLGDSRGLANSQGLGYSRNGGTNCDTIARDMVMLSSTHTSASTATLADPLRASSQSFYRTLSRSSASRQSRGRSDDRERPSYRYDMSPADMSPRAMRPFQYDEWKRTRPLSASMSNVAMRPHESRVELIGRPMSKTVLLEDDALAEILSSDMRERGASMNDIERRIAEQTELVRRIRMRSNADEAQAPKRVTPVC